MGSRLEILVVLGLGSFSVALLAFFGLPYSPLSSQESNPYVVPPTPTPTPTPTLVPTPTPETRPVLPCTQGLGFWKHQFRGKGKQQIDDATLKGFLAFIVFESTIFDEEIALSGIADAQAILSPGKNRDKGEGGKRDGNPKTQGTTNSKGNRKKEHGDTKSGTKSGVGDKTSKSRDRALRHVLAAWLNFAKGAIEPGELVDTDGDGVVDTTFSDLMTEVELILSNPDATAHDLEHAKDLAEAVNEHDKDNPNCDTVTGTGTGTKTRTRTGTGTGTKTRTRTGTGTNTSTGKGKGADKNTNTGKGKGPRK